MEPLHWKIKDIPFSPKHTFLIKDHYTNPISGCPPPNLSTPSCDSGLGISRPDSEVSPPFPCSPMSLSPDPLLGAISPQPLPPFTSQHLVASGGHGFSIGVVNVGGDDECMEQLSIPVPSELEEMIDSALLQEDDIAQSVELMSSLTSSSILSMSVIGESQLLIGTDIGTLHSFEISVSKFKCKLQQHMYIKLNEPILCITSHTLTTVFSSVPTTTDQCSISEILLGVPYGYIIILRGEIDRKGRLKDSLSKLSRRIVRLSNSPIDCAVNCIIQCMSEKDNETYWCACGGNIIVLRSTDWQRVSLMDTRSGLSDGKLQEVIQLLNTDIGVWSALSHSTTVTLWDKDSYSPKLQLTYCDVHRASIVKSDVSVLHYTNSLLFIGTNRGDVMVFSIREKSSISTELMSSPRNHTPVKKTISPRYSYKFVTNTHLGQSPIASIHTKLISNVVVEDVVESLRQSTNDIHVLVVQGGKQTGHMYLFELSLSPPNSIRSSPTSSLASDCTVGSYRNSLTPRRLSVVSAISDYTPLKN